MSNTKDEWSSYLKLMGELSSIIKNYQDNYLPGSGEYIDVFYLKLSCYPADKFNETCGKDKFLPVAFDCITDSKHCILRVSLVWFGAQNDKHIAHLDHTGL